mmetsp:Transcript_66958/g.217904  ORF Transcript_66958/g.217904 Transcript_66958/m.217904 type:complete len:337 (+) Transcript_66958:143-1153(+)
MAAYFDDAGRWRVHDPHGVQCARLRSCKPLGGRHGDLRGHCDGALVGHLSAAFEGLLQRAVGVSVRSRWQDHDECHHFGDDFHRRVELHLYGQGVAFGCDGRLPLGRRPQRTRRGGDPQQGQDHRSAYNYGLCRAASHVEPDHGRQRLDLEVWGLRHDHFLDLLYNSMRDDLGTRLHWRDGLRRKASCVQGLCWGRYDVRGHIGLLLLDCLRLVSCAAGACDCRGLCGGCCPSGAEGGAPQRRGLLRAVLAHWLGRLFCLRLCRQQHRAMQPASEGASHAVGHAARGRKRLDAHGDRGLPRRVLGGVPREDVHGVKLPIRYPDVARDRYRCSHGAR